MLRRQRNRLPFEFSVPHGQNWPPIADAEVGPGSEVGAIDCDSAKPGSQRKLTRRLAPEESAAGWER